MHKKGVKFKRMKTPKGNKKMAQTSCKLLMETKCGPSTFGSNL